MNDISQLRQAALEARDRPEEAARLWEQVLLLSPEHPEALHFQGQQAIRRGEPSAAFALLTRAAHSAPRDVTIHLNLAVAARGIGDEAAELAALDKALAADFSCYPALLTKAELLERRGDTRSAARLSRYALGITPPGDRLSPQIQALVTNARRRVAENARALEDFLRRRLGPREAAAGRLDEVLGIVSGRKKTFVHEPTLLNFPALPAICFYDNAQFDFLAEVAAATETITQELRALLETSEKDFRPYVAHPPNVPVAQWAELNHSTKWSAWFLWDDGKRVEAHCAQCPQTAALLETMPMAQVPGSAPSAFFSTLLPRTHIPPHSGATNVRAIVHLPLIVPQGCRLRVGNEIRSLERGKPYVFDDSIEHEAWNDSDKNRIVLIFDVWNPALSDEQRALVAAVVSGEQDYYSAPG